MAHLLPIDVSTHLWRAMAWSSASLAVVRVQEGSYGWGAACAFGAVVAATLAKRPFDSMVSGFLPFVAPEDEIEVHVVAPGYEEVERVFRRLYADKREMLGSQLCVYVRGELVVDLVGYRPTTDPATGKAVDYNRESINPIFSSSKSITALVVAMMADRGLLDFNEKIADRIWPEFGENGKADITVATLMRHDAGLMGFPKGVVPDATDMTTERIKENAMGKIIEKMGPPFAPDWEKRWYHALSRGWIANEIVRRVDPKGRTIGEILREDIAVPLGIEGQVGMGLTPGEQEKAVPAFAPSLWWEYCHSIVPPALGGKNECGLVSGDMFSKRNQADSIFAWGFPAYLLNDLAIRVFPDALLPDYMSTYAHIMTLPKTALLPEGEFKGFRQNSSRVVSQPAFRAAEAPGGGGFASAFALGRIAAAISAATNERAFLSAKPILSTGGAKVAQDGKNLKNFMGIVDTVFDQTGWNHYGLEHGPGRDGFVGWMGSGGSVLQFHPEHDIGFGFTVQLLRANDAGTNGARLQEAVIKCVTARQ